MYITRTTQITKTIVAEKPTKEIQFKNKHIKRDWEQEQMGQIADLNSTKAAINLKTVWIHQLKGKNLILDKKAGQLHDIFKELLLNIKKYKKG